MNNANSYWLYARRNVKPLSERLEERLKRLKAEAQHHQNILRMCPMCQTYKPAKLPYWRDGQRLCRACMAVQAKKIRH